MRAFHLVSVKKIYSLITLFLSITIPSLALAPLQTQTIVNEKQQSCDLKILNSCLVKYDDVVSFLEKIENEEFNANYNHEDLVNINQFLSRLASEGIGTNDTAQKEGLDQDICMLFGMDEKNIPFFTHDFSIIPAVLNQENMEILLCNWFSKQWRQTKNFVKKHKKALLIGAAVVVTITTVVYVASAVAAAKAAAATAVAAGAQEIKPNKENEITEDKKTKKEPEPNLDTSSLKETPNLAAVLQEGAATIQDFIAEDDIQKYQNADLALKERIREYSATMAHEIVNGLAGLSESYPMLAEEIKDIGNRFFPKISFQSVEGSGSESPLEKFNKLVAEIHKKIDSVFSTNQNNHYLYKDPKGIVLGFLPPPGQVGFLTDEILIASHQKFKRAQTFLKPHSKTFMPESKAKALIHQAGIETFPRPKGIPDNFRVKITDKGGGVEYFHPNHEHTVIRVMPGKQHSPLPCQQKPYVKCVREGKNLDKFGNIVSKNSIEAHIPLEEFVYKGQL